MTRRIVFALLGLLALAACQDRGEAGPTADTGEPTGAFTEGIDTAASKTDTGMVRLDTLRREPRS